MNHDKVQGVAEWKTVLRSLHRQLQVQAPTRTSTNVCRHICKSMDRKGLAAMLSINRCRTRGEFEDRTGEKACKGIHPGFETQSRGHQKFKTRVSVAPRKRVMSSKNVLKKKKEYFRHFFWSNAYYHSPKWTGTKPELTMEISFSLPHQGMYLLWDI